ncbi:protein of unknown function [Chromohalobacter canadensis]|uniref:DUF4214 domain-containing protein n=1 Tax=Chromohalobacter canadensis TaxID=141389 RepID=A0A285VFY5_9GAMM|nr:DUF4214 domain-containing protein [Chromohalobacter canadensis]SOC52867.1 protein of unknown function [Chromohalobacter canadensis]
MASQESLARVQELYVAYYGRPADQEGQEYWADRIDDEGESAIINAFGNSAEYEAMAEGQGNATLVNNLYEQMFGRDADPEGLTYYTGVLESGEKSLAEIATTILNAASGVDQNEFNAKVEAAAEYTETYGSAEDYDIVAAQDAVENAEGGLYTPELTPAIEDYQGAQEAVSDYLQDTVASNEAVAENLEANAADADEPTDTEIDDALESELNDAGGAVETASTNGTAGSSLSLDSNASVAAAQIEAQQEAYADAVDEAEATVAETDGLQGAINSLQSAETRYESALKAEIETDTALDGEFAKFTALNETGATAEYVLNDDGTVDFDPNTSVADDEVAFIEADSNGNLVLADGESASDYEGLDAFLSAAQDQYDATAAVTKQQGTFEEAAEKVINTENDADDAEVTVDNGYSVTDGEVTVDLTNPATGSSADAADALLGAQEAAETFDEAVADYQELSALQDQVDDLNEAVGDAEDAIEEQGVTLQTNTASAEDDLFIFDGEDNAITNFGDSGEDQIYIGDSFTAVEVGSDEALADDALGDSGVLEVFFSDDGTNTTLSFENEAFQGNATNGFEGNTIELTGVTGEQLQLDNGYVSVA